MGYKCSVCGINEVDKPGDICELCAIGQDPYAANMSTPTGNRKTVLDAPNNSPAGENSSSTAYVPKRGTSRKILLHGGSALSNTDPYGNDIGKGASEPSSVHVYSAGQSPQNSQSQSTAKTTATTAPKQKKNAANTPICSGITKNVRIDNQRRSFLFKWLRALFTGIPFTMDNDVTMFQVFPDYSGTALNALGNACDQVIVYGGLNNGAISENNDVEILGRRDANNNVIAKTIRNKASGTIIEPMRTLNTGIVWLITFFVIIAIAAAALKLGVEGIIWTIIIVLCLTNLPLALKIAGIVLGIMFSLVGRLFRSGERNGNK